jgi:outer membrane protein OmpA-like peptidoglycan-associated protein
MVHGLFWLGLLLMLWVSDLVVDRGDGFGGRTPVPLRFNPNLLVLSILGLPCFLLLSWLAESRWREKGRLILCLGLLGASLCFGVIVGAMKPGNGVTVARDLVYSPPNTPGMRVFALPVYFANGQPMLTRAEKKRILDAVTVFSSCQSGTLYVRGFASSLPYRVENEYRNKLLAINRARSVKAVLDSSTGKSAQLAEWRTYDEMAQARRLRDVGTTGERLIDAERLNRRVEVFWNDSLCTQPWQEDQVQSKETAEQTKIPEPGR